VRYHSRDSWVKNQVGVLLVIVCILREKGRAFV
jgi:hypothetical protein